MKWVVLGAHVSPSCCLRHDLYWLRASSAVHTVQAAKNSAGVKSTVAEDVLGSSPAEATNSWPSSGTFMRHTVGISADCAHSCSSHTAVPLPTLRTCRVLGTASPQNVSHQCRAAAKTDTISQGVSICDTV